MYIQYRKWINCFPSKGSHSRR